MTSTEIERGTLTIRTGLQPGDIGTVVKRHGQLYAEEYGWSVEFEALVATIAGGLLDHYDPARERHWIAEIDGQFAGCIFLVRVTDEQAKLRMLLVEPSARGFGLGKRLVADCIEFAREAGYRSITLWTNDVLTAARAIYAKFDFTLVHAEPQPQFGVDLVSETWELNFSDIEPQVETRG
jgi:GNAT superfamily N-acetyltransferase